MADSQQLLEETLRLYKTNQNSETPDAAFAQARLGQTLISEGKFDEAESPLQCWPFVQNPRAFSGLHILRACWARRWSARRNTPTPSR